jgi:hypothetical protein
MTYTQVRLRALALAIAGSGVVSFAAPFTASHNAPAFPIQFEKVQSSWLARGPGYQLVLEDGDSLFSTAAGAIRMEITGSRKNVSSSPDKEVPGRRNYIQGTDSTRWRTNVHLWGQIRFAGVLDGVDVVYHGVGSQLEYDLVISPGVDAASLEISFTGAREVRLDGSGNLILHSAAGDIVQHKPVAYQNDGGERREVAAAFRLDGHRIRFALGEYDRSETLIIDPVIDYATWFPGTVTLLTVDAAG